MSPGENLRVANITAITATGQVQTCVTNGTPMQFPANGHAGHPRDRWRGHSLLPWTAEKKESIQDETAREELMSAFLVTEINRLTYDQLKIIMAIIVE